MQHQNYSGKLFPEKENFTSAIDGKKTDLYFLHNEQVQVAITNYGARIVSFLRRDKNENWTDVVVGFDTLSDYLNAKEIYHGAIIGRYANRIAEGKLVIGEQNISLPVNNGPNHLHGGPKGFHNAVWNVLDSTGDHLTLHYFSRDGEEGYPGNLDVTIKYVLHESDLEIHFSATTDQDTVLNLTNHAYFNLNGQGNGDIHDHMLWLDAIHYTPVDKNLIPTGEIETVHETPFDFTQPKIIGRDIASGHEQIRFGNGYDHNFVLRVSSSNGLKLAARAIGNLSDIQLEVLTDQPGVQLYTGNFMEGTHTLKGGLKDEFRSAFCLETQHFPDSPNHSHFPSTLLKAGETFQSKTIFRLSMQS
ncbi:MAG TPA: aldose epimerase family protein [Flavisolibacter sp.]|jgi:aldose 1-epimerase|nr:aldose epimerase family protein [Flavisolibacter sp.]